MRIRIAALLVFLALSAAQPLGAQIVRVNHVQTSCTNVTACTTTPSISVTAGNLLVVLSAQSKNTTVASITDAAGNTFVTASARVLQTGAGSAETWYAKNVAGNASDQVTVNLSTTDSPDIFVIQYSGLDTASPLDNVAIGSGANGTALSTSNVTTTAANEVLVSFAGANGTLTAGTNYTIVDTAAAGKRADQDRTVSSTGTYNATATASASGAWIINLATFKAAGGAPPAPKRLLLLGIG